MLENSIPLPIGFEHYLTSAVFSVAPCFRAAVSHLNESGSSSLCFFRESSTRHVRSSPSPRVKTCITWAWFHVPASGQLSKQVPLLTCVMSVSISDPCPPLLLAKYHLVSCMFSSLMGLSGSQSFVPLFSKEPQRVFRYTSSLEENRLCMAFFRFQVL